MIYLTKIDAARNLARFYSLDLQPDLFGGWALVRRWGRIGRGARSAAPSMRSGKAPRRHWNASSAAGSGAAMRSRQCRVIGRFLPGRNLAPGEGGCASGKALRGAPAALSTA